MSDIKLVPFLYFSDGQCREAMEFYHSILGGELVLRAFSDWDVPVENPDQIMWSQLSIDSEFTLMACDDVDNTNIKGNQQFLSIITEDVEWARETCSQLAEGGNTRLAFEAQVWGGHFGEIIDRYGMNWSIAVSNEENE